MSKDCLIIGASHTAAQLALGVRRQGWEGRIVVVGDESCLPYHRPPLSKAYLSSEKEYHDLLIRPQGAYEKAKVHFKLGVRAEAIDRESKSVRLDNGEHLHYDKLALTVGARPREITLPGSDKEGVFYLRRLNDADRIRRYVGHGKHAVIIGGGYIGLETAASLRKAGMQVTVLEALPRVLDRVTTEEISTFYQRIHGEEGVNIVTDVGVESIQGAGAAESVACSDGNIFPADLVIVGIGVLPNIELAEAAGLEVGNGIVVDEYARTSDPDIVAAGDCSWHYNPIYDRHIRLESVQNAIEQANVAAATICGKFSAYRALPWFWSDQYDVKLQIAGLSQGYDQVIIRGDIMAGRSFAAFYLREKRLLAVDAVNRPKEFMLGKRIISSALDLDISSLADESIALSNLIEK
jgi:3-phenylpropionate/trans-cinnamate dioxygenase ferredoxin reductase component